MINTIRTHIKNDIEQIRVAWDNMDTLSHVLVFLGITLFVLSFDILSNRIHF